MPRALPSWTTPVKTVFLFGPSRAMVGRDAVVQTGGGLVAGIVEAKRPEHVWAGVVVQRLPRNGFNHAGKQNKIEARVFVSCAGRTGHGHASNGGNGGIKPRALGVAGRPCGQARRVGEQVENRDFRQMRGWHGRGRIASQKLGHGLAPKAVCRFPKGSKATHPLP